VKTETRHFIYQITGWIVLGGIAGFAMLATLEDTVRYERPHYSSVPGQNHPYCPPDPRDCD
jgi:hypothetical protein